MPLHGPAALAVLAAVACATAGATPIAIADDQPAASRYYDIEANKAKSMRELGWSPSAPTASHPARRRP